MKKIVAVLLAMILVLSFAGCGSKAETEDNTLVIYSASDEEFLQQIIPIFEQETGITVEVLNGGAGEIFKRIEAESANPLCDVQLGATQDVAMQYTDYCEEYVSVNDDAVFAGYSAKDYGNKLTPFEEDSAVIMYNTNLIGDLDVSGYEKLTDPSLKGKIALPDPNASGTGLGTLQDYVRIFGSGAMEDDAGWAMLQKYMENLDGKLSSGSGAAARSVVDGESVVTITYEEAAFNYIKDGAPVAICYPEEGVSFSVGIVNIVKGAPHMENAKKFVDFMISDEIQEILANDLMIRPVRSDVELGEGIPSVDTIKTIPCDHDLLAEKSDYVLDRFNTLWADING